MQQPKVPFSSNSFTYILTNIEVMRHYLKKYKN